MFNFSDYDTSEDGLIEWSEKMCPNATETTPRDMDFEDFENDHQMQLVICDNVSFLAAYSTLSLFGTEVSRFSVWNDTLQLLFDNNVVSDNANGFYIQSIETQKVLDKLYGEYNA